MNKRTDIQVLRAVAVIFVVLFHLEIAGVESGFLGVDVFFVVSGFLMAILYKKGETKKFFQRRAKRLLPAYFATVLLTLFFSLFLVLPSELGQVVTQSIYSLFFANNIGFWMQNSYFSKSDFNPLLHLWSLGVEIQFYLIVPLLVWFFTKSKVWLFAALVGSFAACIFIVGISTKTSFFMMPLRMWEFLIGFIVAYYLTINGSVKYKNLSWLGLIGFIALIAIPFIKVDGQTLSRIEGHPSFYALFVCFSTALVLAFGLPKLILNNKFSEFLAKVGDYSYSIYLVHFPIIVLYLYEPFSGTKLYPESYADKIVLLVLIIAASFLMHKYIESRRFNSVKKVYIASLISLVIFSSVAQAVPALYSKDNQKIFEGLNDRATYRCGKLIRITDPSAISCKLNQDDFDQSVLLVGNSHADSIKVTFSDVATKHKFNTYFLVSNEPLMSSTVTNEMLINESKRLNIKRLVVHFSPNSLSVDKIKSLVLLASKNNISVDFIMPIPVYKESVPKSVYQDNIESYTAKNYLSDNDSFISDMTKISADYKNLRLFSVYQVFCSDGCQIADDNKMTYYYDSNHLNLTGAEKLKPVFEGIF